MKFQLFSGFQELVYGISESPDGPMNLRSDSRELERVYASNRHEFLGKMSIHEAQTVFARSVHGAKIKKATPKLKGQYLQGIDGLLTNKPGIFMALTVADCVPVYLFDPKNSVCGLVHAGWRGIALGVVKAVLREMSQNYKSRPQDILLATGPAVLKCHFEVQVDVLEKFQAYPEAIGKGQTTTLDLPKIIRTQALDFGVLANHLELSNLCTFCLKNQYFSHRRDKKNPLQTMLAFIGRRG